MVAGNIKAISCQFISEMGKRTTGSVVNFLFLRRIKCNPYSLAWQWSIFQFDNIPVGVYY